MACYVSLQTGDRAELFNSANGLIIEDSYFLGGETIFAQFTGTDDWNFTNHIADGTANLNWAIAHQNKDKLPTKVYEISKTAELSLIGRTHDLHSIIEYDGDDKLFSFTSIESMYNIGSSTIQKFEMARSEIWNLAESALSIIASSNKLVTVLVETIEILDYIAEGNSYKVEFLFGTSAENNIDSDTLLHQSFIFGGDGNDILSSGLLNDVLVSGSGTNVMDGGSMNDCYFITSSDSSSIYFINDYSGMDEIYLPTGVSVTSWGNYNVSYDTLELSNGQSIYINRYRENGHSINIYDMSDNYLMEYSVQPLLLSRMVSMENTFTTQENTEGELYSESIEIIGENITIAIYDEFDVLLGEVTTTQDTFPLYQPYGYFYLTEDSSTLQAHLFNDSFRVEISTGVEQEIEYISYTIDENDLPLSRMTASVRLSTESILYATPSNEMSEIILLQLESNGGIEDVAVTREDLTQKQYTLEISADENGTVSPSGTMLAAEGEPCTLTFTPDTGYVVDALFINDVAVSLTGNTYTIESVMGDMVIYVTFKSISNNKGDTSTNENSSEGSNENVAEESTSDDTSEGSNENVAEESTSDDTSEGLNENVAEESTSDDTSEGSNENVVEESTSDDTSEEFIGNETLLIEDEVSEELKAEDVVEIESEKNKGFSLIFVIGGIAVILILSGGVLAYFRVKKD